MSNWVLIVGASARAAAASARRAGLEPSALDLFADRDTQSLCPLTVRCPLADYPHGLLTLARRFPPMPWLYTGGLENHPDLIAAIAAERPLWGNGPAVLGQVRDPLAVSSWVRSWAFAESAPQPGRGRWLRKPLRSGGGLNVRDADPADGAVDGFYCQRFIAGRPMSAVVATADGSCEPLAVCTQLIGRDWLHAAPFVYCGNVLTATDRAFARRVGSDLSDRGAVGLWGFDFIEEPDGVPTVVEVNPRYTASVELAELAGRFAALAWHRWGCGAGPEPDAAPPVNHVLGKAIYYAPRRLTIPVAGPWDESLRHCRDVWRRPDFADIPHPGDRFEPGQPVLTLLADGPTERAVVATLKARAADLDRLWGTMP